MKKPIISFISLTFSLNLFYSQSINLQSFGPSFFQPVVIKNAGDDRLFIVEKEGIIKILNSDGTVNATPFLDISSIVGSSFSEQGLLGLAFHPNYPINPNFYINYTNTSGNTIIANYIVSANPDIANSSGTILLTIDQPFTNHNGGCINFGSDGYLYIATGDGGDGGDPGDRAQNLNTLLGKLLRIDIDNGSPYGIPNDNPFLNDGDPSTFPEIWAYGLRNPWKFSFDSQTGELWIADVGQETYEEINLAQPNESGLNYGWRCYEGNQAYNTTGCPSSSTMTFPIAEYSHNGSGAFKCSITGGYMYRGITQTTLVGKYIFADYCSGEIGILSNSGSWSYTFSPQSGNWVAFGEDINGELYIADITSGNIFRIVEDNLDVDEYGLSNIKIYPNPSQGIVNFDFTGMNHNDLTIDVYSLQGQMVHHIENVDKEIFEMKTNNLQNGFYIVEIKNSFGNTLTYKFIVDTP